MKLLRSIAKRWRNLSFSTATAPQGLSLNLAAEGQSYVGPVPSMPEGSAGHKALIDAFFEIVDDKKPQVFCDVGANRGEAGRRALAGNPDMNVFGFEANPKIHQMYASVNIKAGVNWINKAISAQTGDLELYIPRVLARAFKNGTLSEQIVIEAEDTGKSSILRRDENAEYDIVKVPTVTLDDYLRMFAPDGRVALWIDVEGAASAVLDGAAETLNRTDVLVVEVEGFAFWQDQTLVANIIDTLQRKGFIPVLRDREYEDAQFNIIFIRKDEDYRLLAARIGRVTTPPVLHGSHDNSMPSASGTPLIIPCFNNPSFCRSILEQSLAVGFEDITFVDNASEMSGMLHFLEEAESSGAKVERLEQNLGPHKSIFTTERLTNLPRYFCVTDPDLSFNPALPSDFIEIMAETLAETQFSKVGFALDISNRSEMKTEKFEIEKNRHDHIWEWEEQFWAKRINFTSGGDAVYQAAVDTTFALYDKNRFVVEQFFDSLRMGGRFTATHLPWLNLNSIPKSEERFYRDTQKHSYYLK